MNNKTCRSSSFVVHRLFTEASENFPEAPGNLPEGFKNLPGICGRNLPASRAVQSPCTETLTGALRRPLKVEDAAAGEMRGMVDSAVQEKAEELAQEEEEEEEEAEEEEAEEEAEEEKEKVEASSRLRARQKRR